MKLTNLPSKDYTKTGRYQDSVGVTTEKLED